MGPWNRFCRSLVFGLGRLLWGLRVEGRENVPREGGVLIAANHISLLDPPILGSSVPREVGFVAKKELFEVPGIGRLIASLNSMPVDRSRLSMAALRRFGEFLGRDKALVFFPEGTRSRDGKLGRAKIGIGILLALHPVTVVPAYIEGTDSLFRNLFRRGRMRVVFGRPYSLPKEEAAPSRREEYRRLADAVMDRIRLLKEGTQFDDREPGLPDEESAAPR